MATLSPPLGTAPDTLYLHDMAVLPGMAGKGLARRLLQPLWEQAAAQGLHQPEQQQRLASYGEGAVYMARTLQAI